MDNAPQFTLYQATNVINGKRYIGITKRTVAQRRALHYSSAKKGLDGCWRFNAAIRKYGRDAFKWDVLAILATFQEGMAAEIRAIADQRPEYNITKGGEGFLGARRRSRAVVCLTDGQWFSTIKEAAVHYGMTIGRISTIYLGHEITARGLYFIHSALPLSDAERRICLAVAEKDAERRLALRLNNIKAMRSRPIICLTDGKAYPSAVAAAAAYELVPSRIMQLCKAGQTTTGLRFMYADATKPPPLRVHRTPEAIADGKARHAAGLLRAKDATRRPVICLDDGRAYPSASAASLAHGLTHAVVWNGINTGGTARGLTFHYVHVGDYL